MQLNKFGEVSPSIVSASKLPDKALECIFSKLFEFSFPSINTKLSKVAKSGLISRNTAARKISRLSKKISTK